MFGIFKHLNKDKGTENAFSFSENESGTRPFNNKRGSQTHLTLFTQFF
jgi:hypothetical protein